MSFQDQQRCSVHILKEHPFQCQDCGDKYTKKENLDIHIITIHAKEMKCKELAEELNTDRGTESFCRIAKQMVRIRADVTESLA